jgi:hypothetical protein
MQAGERQFWHALAPPIVVHLDGQCPDKLEEVFLSCCRDFSRPPALAGTRNGVGLSTVDGGLLHVDEGMMVRG